MYTVTKEEYQEMKKRFECLESKEEMTNEELQELDEIANSVYIYEIEHAGE